jgi:uncharacterized protein GlcG (DUF336 family)
VLPLAPVGRELEHAAVAQPVRLVAVEERLHAVGAARHPGERRDGVAERGRVDRAHLAGAPPLDVHAEHELRPRPVGDLEAGLVGRVGREQQEQPAVERRAAARGRVGDLHAQPLRREGPGGGDEEGADERGAGERETHGGRGAEGRGPARVAILHPPARPVNSRRASAHRPMRLRPALVVLAAASALAARPARAQLAQQPVLTLEAARRAAAAAEAEARRNNWRVSVAVVDAHGELVAFHRMDDAPYTSGDIAQAKARSAARFRRPTAAFDSTLAAGRTALLALPGVVPVAGGVPVTVGGRVVGAVGVSGVTSQQDAQCAAAGAAAVTP